MSLHQINGRKVRTDAQLPGVWSAIDDDLYDGAPDGHRTIGIGVTEQKAIADLLEQLED